MPYYPLLKDAIWEYGFKNPDVKLCDIAKNILRLKEKISREIPSKSREDKLLLATFNIREFDHNRKLYGPRTIESLYYLAEIISAFDLIAVQEINRDLKPFNKLMRILGRSYDFLITDITEGRGGNEERMAFIYDKNKITFQNLAGEVVLPLTLAIPQERQFARTPYLVGFQAGWFKFNLCTVHIYFGEDSGELFERRVKEIEDVSMFFKKRSQKEKENFILLGDFNVKDKEDATMQALLKGGFNIPEALHKRPGSNVKQDRLYDQIVYREGANGIRFSGKAGVFNFYDTVFSEQDRDKYYEDYALQMKANGKPAGPALFKKQFNEWRTFQMSDHLPLWVEFDIDYSQAYLNRLIQQHNAPEAG